ncbi:hypothetical protein [Streptomyces sp. HUAS ZL42]|uniref:hypothetical protein n=1 Tax=Streptomyces sp. HUAS ZL42 TaxID=3231715 RepID=UPI00345EBC29
MGPAVMTAAVPPTVPLVREQVRDVLLRSPAYRALDEPQRRRLAHDMVNVGQYLADAGGQTAGAPLGVLTSEDAERDFGRDAARALAQDTGSPPDTAGARFAGQGGAVAAAAGTRSLANLVSSVDFPAFVSGLIQGVFQAIVDSSIQQMEAFAELVKNVSKSVDEYMKDNVTENQARDYLAERYPDHLQVDLSTPTPQVKPKPAADESNLPDFFKDLGLDMPVESLDEETPEQVLMPAARQQMAIDRQRMLLMMVMMGINRLVVTDGSIKAAVIFELDTRDSVTANGTRATNFDGKSEGKSKSGFFSGWFSPTWEEKHTSQFTVTTTQTDSSEASDELKAKLTGDVNVRFRSETFPLQDMTKLLGLQEPTLPTSGPRPPTAGSGTA